jgi:hypothetical protein
MNDTVPQWTPKRGSDGRGKRLGNQQLVLVGARFERSFLEGTQVATLEVHFQGELLAALSDLRQAARDSAKNSGYQLPIRRLRTSLLARLPNLISLDTALGLPNRESREARPVASLYRLSSEGDGLIDQIAACLKRWCRDALDPWADKHEAARVAERVLKAALPSNITLAPRERTLLRRTANSLRPDLPLIARQAAESLIGEELFAGLPPCELVIDALNRDPARSNEIDLMSAPFRLPGRDESFSMVATLTAITMPYSDGVYLKTSASKRVWAKSAPDRKRNAPFLVRGYLVVPERPVYTVSLERGSQGWEFGDDYAEWRALEGDLKLPPTLAAALKVQLPDGESSWVGVPELTTLYDSVSPRTVFEGDEIDLAATVATRLKGIVATDIPFKPVPFTGKRTSADVTMLKLADVSDLGLAGQAVDEEEDDETAADEGAENSKANGDEADGDAQREKLRAQRERNAKVLGLIHGQLKPTLWLFHQTHREREIVEKSVEQLFGDAIELKCEQLPKGTHGLKADLPGAELKAAERFNVRVESWRQAAELVRGASAARYVLICASDREQGRAEDQVNYYAGIHAMCSIAGANVHHVLPIGGGDPVKAQQHFVHRLQSALLDVFFAHSGVVFGTEPFLNPLFAGRPPKYVYGIQALRSNARNYSGELNVSFLLFTRLNVKTGKSQVRFVYRKKRSTQRTEWLEFSEGLKWLGSQRQLESDEIWLKASAAEQVRFWLGEIADDDPRALVLIDWSSMASLWKGISDEDLTFGGGPLIDGRNIASVCPEMTLVRLRRNGRALSLRTLNTFLFARLRTERADFAGQRTGESYTDSYATTTKRIVAVTERKGDGVAHYIQSMKYRRTAQPVRGQSCYRTMERMQRRKDAKNVFELRVLEPSREDAALPAPLEVTVMSHPKDVNADNVAIAVLGMRLGYVHYGEWTTLPAPLFFRRKIEDYVIRYRSPASVLADEPLEEETEVQELPVDGRQAPITAEAQSSPVESQFVRESANTVAQAAGVTGTQVGEYVAVEKAAPDEEEEEPPEAPVILDDRELEINVSITDEALLELVKRVAHADIALCGLQAKTRRHLYRRMLRGIVRATVGMPSFVTPAAIRGNDPPTDRRALQKFWSDLQDLDFLKHGDPMPSLSRLHEWIFRRLHIPQAGYSLFMTPGLFPVSLFAPVREAWREYVEKQRTTETEDETEELSEDYLELDRLTKWAVTRRDDELIAWLVFGSAHFPMRPVLDQVIPNLSLPIGPVTREALHYFVISARAARAVLAIRPGSGAVPINFPSPPRSIVTLDAERARAVATCQITPPSAKKEASAEAPTSEAALEATAAPAGAASPASGEPKSVAALVELTTLLRGGNEDFPSLLDAIRRELSKLEKEHERIVAARVQEAENAAAEQVQAARATQWANLRDAAQALLSHMRAELPDTQLWTVSIPADAPPFLDEAQREAERLEVLAGSAVTAQREYQTVVEHATPPAHLTPRDAGRHRQEWQEAVAGSLQTFETALHALGEAFRTSSALFCWSGQATGVPPESQHESTEAKTLSAQQPTVERAHPTAAGTLVSPPQVSPATSLIPAAPNEALRGETPAEKRAQEIRAQKPSEAKGAPAQVKPLESVKVVRAPVTEPQEEEETQDVEPAEPEVHLAEGRAAILGELVPARALALGELYAECCDLLERPNALRDDHGLLTRAGLESIRALRGEIPLDHPLTSALSAELAQRGLDTSGCEALGSSLGLLAAGLNEMLFPPLTGSARWTFVEKLRPRLSSFTPLAKLLKRIEDLEGFNLAREVLTTASIGERTEAQSVIYRMRERAKNWSEEPSLYTTWTKWDYKALHDLLFKDASSPIAQCLTAIAGGEDQKAEHCFHEARKLLEKPTRAIDYLAQRFNRKRSFHGAGRYHVQLNMERTLEFVKEYFEAVKCAKGLTAPISGHAREALDGLYREIASSIEYVSELSQLPSPHGELYRKLAHLALESARRIFHGEVDETAPAHTDLTLMLRLPIGRDLKPSIYPKVDAAGNTVPAVVDPLEVIEEIEALTRDLKAAGDKSLSADWIKGQLERAAQDHYANNRLLPLKMIDKRLGRTLPRTAEQNKVSSLLIGELQRERQRVTHAMALGALTQTEASRMLRVIEELLHSATARTISDLEAAPEAYPDFPHVYVALRRLVTLPLEERLQASKDVFFTELDHHVRDNGDGAHFRSDVDRIRKLASEGSASNIRAARDMFSLLKEGALPKRLVAPARGVADEYKEFIGRLKHDVSSHLTPVKSLIARLKEAPRSEEPESLKRLDVAARREATNFLQTWITLCDARSMDETERLLKAFFRGLASIEPGIIVQPQSGKGARMDFSLDKPFAGLDPDVTGVFIPPTLGSRALYVHGIIFRHKPTDAAIGQAVEEQGTAAPTFIFCQGSLTLEQRAALSRHHPVLLIDDDLVMFAAVHPDTRLAALMRVALLTYLDNPYDDYGGNPVPPEMFFGRREERRALENVKAAAVLYGGRRLGKSSLLDQVRRDGRAAGAETVLYIPLNRAAHGVSDDYEFLGWDAIRRAMTHAGILAQPKREPTNAREVQRFLEGEVLGDRVKVKRIYLLIDEADELMGHDLNKKGSPFISSLVHLAESVREKCALRFVIAGLHNLTRMASDENSALGKFDAIALKPFWSAEDIKRGIDLIRVPLEALGYYFAPGKEDMPLRVMAVCNFYPAFIQLYCKRLLAHLHNRRDRHEPPTFIDERDLDAVELDKEFLGDIRAKFKLNLSLDKRYATIALILADQYYSEGSKSLTASEIRGLCELVAPRHFTSTGPGGYEALLEEMEILTILERGAGGRYSLRTPNIAMMIGDRESVEQQLDSLKDETPAQTRSRGEIRLELNPTKKESREHPIFPMPAAWVRGIFGTSAVDAGKSDESPDRNLLILVGNERSGIGAFGRVKGEAHIADTATLDVAYYPSAHAARSALVRSARTIASTALRGRRLHCIASGSWNIDQVEEYVRLAGTLAQRPPGTPAGFPVMRLALIANPDQAYGIARLTEAGTNAGLQVVAVPPWSDDALYYYLESTEKPELCHSNAAREALLSASCGFGSDVERLCGPRHSTEEAFQAIADAERQLAPSLEIFYQQIGMPRALSSESLRRIEDLLRVLDGEKRESAETEEYRSECSVSEATFEFVQWMGLLQEAPGGLWRVPTLYKRLLK